MGMRADGSEDPFRPPDIPIEVHCIHCGEEYESYLIKWVPDEKRPGEGFWSCPTPGCDGIGFCFDIWPTDPDWRDENGEKVCFFDDGDEFDEDDEFDDHCDPGDDKFGGEGLDYSDFPPQSEDQDDVPWTEFNPGESSGEKRKDHPFGDEDIPF